MRTNINKIKIGNFYKINGITQKCTGVWGSRMAQPRYQTFKFEALDGKERTFRGTVLEETKMIKISKEEYPEYYL